MFSQRGLLNLAHNEHELRELRRRVNANRLNGIDAEFLTTAAGRRMVPILDCRPNARYPVLGASLQRRGGVARHDAVAWGYARAADERGVDIIQNCEVTGLPHRGAAGSRASRPRGAPSAPGRSAAWPPAIPACWPRWPGSACRSRAIRCRRWCREPIKPVLRHRGHVERGPCLCQPVRQGRAGDRRRHRRLSTPMPRPAARRSSRTC